MSKLDPQALFTRLSNDIPMELHEHLFVIGSLAAAYHFSNQLQYQTLNTKDADLVVHPAGDIGSCQKMAERLRSIGWSPKEDARFQPQATAEPLGSLPFIRLCPPDSQDYFVEFLSLPEIGQRERLRLIPVQLSDGWFATPSFRYFVLLALHRQRSKEGLEYAAPSMMALGNLLAHPEVGTQIIEGDGRLRSAKDLGRVLALVRFSGFDEVEQWGDIWLAGLRECFPSEWRTLATGLGSGLRELLASDIALEQARQFNEAGLLSGKNINAEMLRVTGERLMQFVLEPLAEHAGA